MTIEKCRMKEFYRSYSYYLRIDERADIHQSSRLRRIN
ncbi:hypothetical protein D1AOALGA4SA_11821 [Olavius algarvensis Delta 1 endosymbiont]|nr:hypothetical protein D1AOALGA4SA_11821 [Olavius algarvensis Delta 1 endosymbiont]